jgi:hypothetical protein
MTNLSNELGISKNQKIQILSKMGYTENSIIKGLYTNKSKELSLAGTKHWIKETDLDSSFVSEQAFKDFVTYKLNK